MDAFGKQLLRIRDSRSRLTGSSIFFILRLLTIDGNAAKKTILFLPMNDRANIFTFG
jgi:hypothetical protein